MLPSSWQVYGESPIPRGLVLLGLEHAFQVLGLVHGLAVEVDLAGVEGLGGDVPVALNQRGVGVVVAKQAVGDARHPHVALVGLPSLHNLRAGDDGAAGHLGTVGDAAVVGRAAVFGVDPLPVIAGQDDDFIAGNGHLGRLVYSLERRRLGAIAAALYAGGNINLQCNSSL